MRQARFLESRDNLEREAGALFDPRNKLGAVGGVAKRRGRRGDHPLRAERARLGGELLDRRQSARGGVRIEPPRRIDAASQAGDS